MTWVPYSPVVHPVLTTACLAGGKLVDFETFQRVLNRPGGFRDPGEPDEYCRGFQVFDKDMTGFIGVGQLKYILTNLGEKMSEEEVDELLKAVDTSSGQVNYTGMLRFLGCLSAAIYSLFYVSKETTNENVHGRTCTDDPRQLRAEEWKRRLASRRVLLF